MYILLILLLLLLLLLLLKEGLFFFGLVFTNLVFKCKKPLYGNTYALSKKNTFFIKKVLTLSKLEAILLTVDILIFNTQRSLSMAETIQVHLPAELTPVFEEIREVRAKQFKPTSNKSIVIDAVKDMHKKVTK